MYFWVKGCDESNIVLYVLGSHVDHVAETTETSQDSFRNPLRLVCGLWRNYARLYKEIYGVYFGTLDTLWHGPAMTCQAAKAAASGTFGLGRGIEEVVGDSATDTVCFEPGSKRASFPDSWCMV